MGSLGGYIYGEYISMKTSNWYEIIGYRDKNYLRADLMEVYARDCNSKKVNEIQALFDIELSMYKRQLSGVKDIPFVNSTPFIQEHERSIKNQEERLSEISTTLSYCK